MDGCLTTSPVNSGHIKVINRRHEHVAHRSSIEIAVIPCIFCLVSLGVINANLLFLCAPVCDECYLDNYPLFWRIPITGKLLWNVLLLAYFIIKLFGLCDYHVVVFLVGVIQATRVTFGVFEQWSR